MIAGMLLPASIAALALAWILACGAAPPDAARSPAAPATASAPSPGGSDSGAPQPGATIPGAEQALPLVPVATGASSRLLGDRRATLIRDAEAWRAWLQGLGLPPPQSEPDFSRDVVLAVDGEDGSNGCHAVRIVRVLAMGAELRAEVVRLRPRPEQACTLAMIRPVHAVVVRPPSPVASAAFSWTESVGEPAP